MEQKKSTVTLPEGWIWTTIPELFLIIGGGTPAKNNISFWNGNINWASVKDVKSKYLSETEDKITEFGVAYSNTNLAKEDDLVFVTRISPGQVSIVKKQTAINQDLKILKIFGGVSSSFVYYLLSSCKNQFISQASGTTVKGLKINDLNEIKLPLPPLEEQHRIVARIEELFSELDHAEEALKKAQRKLEVYKQALLKSAFEGSETKQLGDYATLITKGASPKWQGVSYTERNKGVLFITSENIRNNYIDLGNSKFVEEKINKIQSRSILQKGDVLLNIVGASIGRSACYNFDTEANTNQAVAIIRSSLNPKFLSFYLNSSIANNYFSSRMVNVARANISLKDVAEIPVPICSEKKQDQIVQILETKLTLTENLDSTITKTLSRFDFSRQSILKKAFAGKLIPQSSSDESVLELIKRIRKEKQVYLDKLKLDEKKKPIKKVHMEKSNLSVKEVLQKQTEAISAKQIWKLSKFQDDSNIDLFYAELKELEDSIFIELEGKETLIAWRNENQ